MTDVQEVLDNFYHEYGDGITQIGIYDNEDIPIEFRQRFEELMQNLYKLYNDMSDWYYGERRYRLPYAIKRYEQSVREYDTIHIYKEYGQFGKNHIIYGR